MRFRARRQAQYSALRDRPCVTKDGQKVELLINAGLAIDLPHIDDTGSAGIGLFRTELQFMVSPNLPRSSDQLALSRTVPATCARSAGARIISTTRGTTPNTLARRAPCFTYITPPQLPRLLSPKRESASG